MAAGLTLPRQHFETFSQAFETVVRRLSDNNLLKREFVVDGSLSVAQRTLGNAQLLASLMPWGQAFEAPLFADTFTVQAQRIVGKGHLKLTLVSTEPEQNARKQRNPELDAIAFNCTANVRPGDSLFLVYSLEVNSWRDRQTLQLRVHHLEEAGLR